MYFLHFHALSRQKYFSSAFVVTLNIACITTIGVVDAAEILGAKNNSGASVERINKLQKPAKILAIIFTASLFEVHPVNMT